VEINTTRIAPVGIVFPQGNGRISACELGRHDARTHDGCEQQCGAQAFGENFAHHG
jgi:hypothetical protein